MIEKSLFLISVIGSLFGFNAVENKFDDAIYQTQVGSYEHVVASNLERFLPDVTKTPEVRKNAPKANIYARNYLLADIDSGKVFLGKNEQEPVPIASTTKIMTALVVLENYNLDQTVSVSSTAAHQVGADAYLRVGEEMSVSELLYCLLIKSGNDAAYALATHINHGSDEGIEKFVLLMNQKAEKLGMKNTRYEDPAGLDTSGYSTAYDLLLLSREVMKNNLFKKIVSTDKYVAKNIDNSIHHQMDNSNRLVGEYNYLGANGIKTGYMPEAGHCLVSSVERDNHTLVGVVLYTTLDTATASADESRKLLDWGFANIDWY